MLEKVTALRARTGSGGPDAQRLAAKDELSRGIGRLLATAEAYPDLKASASYLDLQRRISGLEEQIAHRREYYNAAVNLNNVRMEQFRVEVDEREIRLVSRHAGIEKALARAAGAPCQTSLVAGGRY